MIPAPNDSALPGGYHTPHNRTATTAGRQVVARIKWVVVQDYWQRTLIGNVHEATTPTSHPRCWKASLVQCLVVKVD